MYYLGSRSLNRKGALLQDDVSIFPQTVQQHSVWPATYSAWHTSNFFLLRPFINIPLPLAIVLLSLKIVKYALSAITLPQGGIMLQLATDARIINAYIILYK